jgi:hypothetical protein
MPVINIVGIGPSEQEAALRPKPVLSTDIQTLNCTTNGKIFVGIEILKNGAQFALQMLFDGKPVAIKDNEKGMNSTGVYTSGRYESYAVDLPSRLLTVQKEPHTVQFLIGKYDQEQFIESGRSRMFEIYVTGETPKIDPKVKPEDRD